MSAGSSGAMVQKELLAYRLLPSRSGPLARMSSLRDPSCPCQKQKFSVIRRRQSGRPTSTQGPKSPQSRFSKLRIAAFFLRRLQTGMRHIHYSPSFSPPHTYTPPLHPIGTFSIAIVQVPVGGEPYFGVFAVDFVLATVLRGSGPVQRLDYKCRVFEEC